MPDKEKEKLNTEGRIMPVEIINEMRTSYLDYAMSVIVARALPDVRDGLKPVQRRILYAMHELGLRQSARFLKSARVIGDVLGKYHPHGDSAVYGALARMAQDFSLRYMLVDGQGNFGCFTKDTKVKLTDGRDLNFGDLIKEYNDGKVNYTYTVNHMGLISIAEIKHPRLTKKSAEIMKVVLDNGEEIRCTLNHQFMLRNGLYKEAKDLKRGESLMPLYQKLSEKTDKLNRDGYVLIYQNKKGEWVPAHHLADNYNLSGKKYLKEKGRVRHHIDFNKLNNNPDNIMRMHWGEHWKTHYDNALILHENEEYREKIAKGRAKFWADPKNKERYSRKLSERNIQNWQDSGYREKMCQMLSDVNKEYIINHPEKRLELSERASKTLKKLWQNPHYKKLFNEKIVKANKSRVTNNTGKVKFLKICKEVLGDYKVLNGKLYENLRYKIYPNSRATSWDKGFEKYYNNSKDSLFKDLNFNHKVLRTELLDYQEDVYDLTIEGTHNFALATGVFVHNSIDGDAPAAMRYTEARLKRISEEMLFDIEKETVDFVDNYDGSRKEPKVLPSKVPQLLLNGQMGIAVGMATNIPPHNLNEVIDATMHLIDSPKATVDDLLEFIQGPDFPTGGIIYNKRDIAQAYNTGRGPILTRGRAEVVEKKSGQQQIIITEIPYQVNKADMITKMADLVRDKKVEGIKDIRDESDKDGLRVVIDLKNDAYPQKILNTLYKFTDLQKTYHLNLVALVDGVQPHVLSLKSILEYFIVHRQDVVTRRAQHELKKAKEREHILEGLKKALDHIDEIIKTIKKSESKDAAHTALMKNFKLSELQATAILEMRLQTLSGLERKKIEDELKEKRKLIAELEALLKSRQKILDLIKNELVEIKEKYGDERKTKVVKGGVSEFKEEDLIPEENIFIALTRGGYIKRVDATTYRTQKRGGKGVVGMDIKEEDVLEHLISCSTHDNLLFFTDKGKVYQSKAYEVPEASRIARGKAIVNILDISQQEKITALVPVKDKLGNKGVKSGEGDVYLAMSTQNGIIKKVSVTEFHSVRKTGVQAISLKSGDLLKWVRVSRGKDEIIILTKNGQAIRFSEKDVRPMGRIASGVTSIKLKKGDQVVGTDIIPQGEEKNFGLLVIMENGFGKQTDLKEYKIQKRGGSGVKTAKVTPKTGLLIASFIVGPEQGDLIVISNKGTVIRTSLESVPSISRATQGVRIMKLEEGDKIASITCL